MRSMSSLLSERPGLNGWGKEKEGEEGANEWVYSVLTEGEGR